MQEAHVADFSNLELRALLQHSKTFYALRIGGFIVTTCGGLSCMIWGISTGRYTAGFVAMGLCVLVGLAMFISSIHTRSDCASCRRKLNVYYCSEERENGRHSGYIYVCRHCHAYEVRLNLVFD
jgi:hypothetical protein